MGKVRVSHGSIIFFLLATATLAVAYYFRSLVILTLVGLGVGALLAPLLNTCRDRYHLSRGFCAMMVLMILVVVAGGAGWGLFHLVEEQVGSLLGRAPIIYDSFEKWVSGQFARYPWLEEQVNQVHLAGAAQRALSYLFRGFTNGIFAVTGAALAVLMGLYTAVHAREYKDATLEALPPRHRSKARRVMEECGLVLREWFKAQLLDMAIIGVLTAGGLWAVGVEYWAVYGLLTAVLGIIPFLGIILVVGVASVVTLVSQPEKLPWVLGVFLVTQQLEGNVVLPLVMKGRIQLPVVPLMVFMLFMTAAFGAAGVFIAPPLFAVLKTLYKELYLPWVARSDRPGLASPALQERMATRKRFTHRRQSDVTTM